MTLRRPLVLAVLALAGALAAQPALATSPGRAGRIAYVNGAFVESVLPAGGASKRLSSMLTHGSYGPSWSPDGASIALTIQEPDARHIEILHGGKLRDVARGRSPAWSPDGRWIAFLSGQKVGSAVFLVHSDGTGLHAIGPRHLALGSSAPAWSPDGHTLVYARAAKVGQVLWSIGSDGRGARPVVTGRFAAEPSFAPDGRHFAFIGFTVDGRMGIWIAAADGSGAQPVHIVPGAKTLFHHPVYAPDGRSIAFVLQGVWQRVAVIRADGGGQRFVSPRSKFIGGLDWARA